LEKLGYMTRCTTYQHIKRVRLLPVSPEQVQQQEKNLTDIKGVLHDNMIMLGKEGQLSINFLNAYSDLIDGASVEEISAMLAVFSSVYLELENVGSHDTRGDNTIKVRSIGTQATEYHSSSITA